MKFQSSNRFSVSSLATTIVLSLSIAFFYSCNEGGTPKPRGHFRIDLPEKDYLTFDSICPFTFEYPVYGIIAPEQGATEPCWFNIEFPAFKGKIHLSYKKVNRNIDLLIADSHKLAYKHSVKADAIEESYWENFEKSVYGTVYLIRGNAASSIQFYVTDSVAHYLRGSLYFETQPDKDSLAPVIDFFRKDVIHLVETLIWK